MSISSILESYKISSNVTVLKVQPHTPVVFEPGQYMVLQLPDGPSRCYSMARAPQQDGSLEFHIRCWPGGAFSDRALEALRANSLVTLSAPLGEFLYPKGNDPVVMLATGTGIAPFLAMLERNLPTSQGRSICLYWGMRTEGDFYARDRLELLVSQYSNFRFVPVISSAQQAYVQEVARQEMGAPEKTIVLACGSPQMIEAARQLFTKSEDVPVKLFLSDAFIATDPEEKTHSFKVSQSASEQIKLYWAGRPITVHTGISLLAALKEAGEPMLSVCGGKASCGTCCVSVVSEWRERLEPPARKERNLLACLPGDQSEGRLACQIHLTTELNGFSFTTFENCSNKEG